MEGIGDSCRSIDSLRMNQRTGEHSYWIELKRRKESRKVEGDAG